MKDYRRKRDFSRTPEPSGGARGADGRFSFVIQKHHASRLHYDLRLETGGALASWAVPKGPSLDPGEKRLALKVEDHPLDYADFEGIIPPGNYGAGTVMVWDRGTYRPAHSNGDPAKAVEQGIAAGKLAFVLEGEKLRGEFYLFRMRRPDGNAWLLRKKEDVYSRKSNVFQERSALTGRTMDEIAERGRSLPGGAGAPDASGIDLKEAPAVPMPHDIRPMLSTLVPGPFDRRGWLFEIKWDGYRALAELDHGRVRLYSRNGKGFEKDFPPIVRSLRLFDQQAVLDGEIVAVDREGKADFQLLQNYLREGKGILVYFVFDLLYLNGHDLRQLPLIERKNALERILPRETGNVKFSVHVENEGRALFKFVSDKGIEGMLAKDGASVYEEGRRSRAWQKIKAEKRQDAVIGGFTSPGGGRKRFGSLLLGVFDEGRKLVYIGHSGGGFTDRELEELYRKFIPLKRKRSPFRNLPAAAGVTWLEPELVCGVRFTEWTGEGLMRHPVYLGLRPDKPAAEVVREGYAPAPKRYVRGENGKRLVIGGKALKLTNLSKVFWPDEGYTKRDLIEYYRKIAPAILPFLVDRPQSLHRHPDGIYGASFFHKDVGAIVPKWVKTFPEGEGEDRVVYMLCQDEASLVYMVNLGCIEINPWNSRVRKPGHPDYLALDFDPLNVPFSAVIEAVLATREVLDKIGCPAYCKTSGATGMHLYVPLGARYTYVQARGFAELLNRYVQSRLPSITSVARMPRKRDKKVYLDYLQNAEGKTMAAPFAVRPREKATVSCPLYWKEVTQDLDPSLFTIRTVPEMIKERRDAWKDFSNSAVDLLSCLRKLEEFYQSGAAATPRVHHKRKE